MTTILSRKRDLIYFTSFIIHLPFVFLVDLQTIYHPSILAILPQFFHDIKSYYISNFNDRFFIETPLYFEVFAYTELAFQLPIMVWAIYGLYKDSPKVPLVLLPWAILVSLTTLVCIVEIWSWPSPTTEKVELMKLYVPYLILPTVMGADMYLRLNDTINRLYLRNSTSLQKKEE
ncbi:transmembrane protein 6/97 [Tricladium varicosporioides]|nr:transmembrane protein 6/97 [Hymenoscyphus varicosporioides]